MKSTFYNEQKTKQKLVEFILGAETLSMGTQCQTFEKHFAAKQGRKYALFVSSGSMANQVLIQALLNLGTLQKGDNVAISSLTWATNIMPLIELGLVPVIIDCKKETLNVSSVLLENAVKNKKVQAFFITNALGFSGDMNVIRDFCKKEKIIFLEDNCESLGSKTDGTLLGNFGVAATFSSFVGHHFSTIEGGMVVTDDEKLYDMLLMVRAHGWDRNLVPEKQKALRKKNGIDDFFARYTFYDLAYNARPTEIQGCIGNTQLEYWDEIVEKREANFQKFYHTIENNDDFLSLDIDHMEIVSNFAMPVVCKTKELFLKYCKKFENANVEIRPIIAGDMTKQPFYRKYVKNVSPCKNANFLHQNGFYFPNNPELTEEEVNILVKLLRF